jgi:hypothetical protein
MKPLSDYSIISESEYKEIFINLNDIRELNYALLERFQEKLAGEKRNDPKLVICDELLRVSPLFQFYFTYCMNYESAAKKRAILRSENHELDEFITKAEKSP